MSSVPLKRSQRTRKIINYFDVVRGKGDTDNDVSISEVSEKTATSDDDAESGISTSSEESWFSVKKKLKIPIKRFDSKNRPRKSSSAKRASVATEKDLVKLLAITDDVEEDANEYRLQRQKQLLDREMVLKSIALNDDIQELKAVAITSPVVRKVSLPSIKRPVVKREVVTSRRRSVRLQNRSLVDEGLNDFVENSQPADVETDDKSELPAIDENLNIMETEEDKEFMLNLKDAVNIPYDSVDDFTTCDFDKFKDTIKHCHMFEEPVKIITSRIVSMDFHPSERKLLILAGDKYGNITLRDLSDYKGVQIKGHQYNTNCLKFSRTNSTKFYSTSLDGTVRQGDIETSILNLLYTSHSHTTWHHESGHSLYVAEGDGAVRLLDLRSSNDNPPSFQCHKRSVRTVQTHPQDENYFLTSSGTGYFGVWDIRHIKADEPTPIIMENFQFALTSAFYSAKGRYVLTTGNDDTIRVFECVNDKSTEISKVSHNNHTGRWLSVFKAMWQPQREDCFYVGSMMNPRRMQLYTENGSLFHEFRSESLNTVCSVISVHPTKPVIVGGNGSGKIHIFSPFKNLTDI